jgi:hypothetical protein
MTTITRSNPPPIYIVALLVLEVRVACPVVLEFRSA